MHAHTYLYDSSSYTGYAQRLSNSTNRGNEGHLLRSLLFITQEINAQNKTKKNESS